MKLLTIISIEKFSKYNIPIAIEYSEELDSFLTNNLYFGEKDIPIIFNILDPDRVPKTFVLWDFVIF